MKDALFHVVDELKGELIELTKELIETPTENPPGNNYKDCALFIEKKLREIGVETKFIKVPESLSKKLAPHGLGLPRISVIGRVKGKSEDPTFHFHGHYDVVPAGKGWTMNPFKPKEKNGKIFGRGAADMKGGLASIIIATKAFLEAYKKFDGTLTFSFTPDEETGGAAGAEYIAKMGHIKADMAIMPEPTGIDTVWNAA